jgi:hypothetical protein
MVNKKYEYEAFEDWFNEIENYGMRGERFFEELDYMSKERLKDWLRAAFECGRSVSSGSE